MFYHSVFSSCLSSNRHVSNHHHHHLDTLVSSSKRHQPTQKTFPGRQFHNHSFQQRHRSHFFHHKRPPVTASPSFRQLSVTGLKRPGSGYVTSDGPGGGCKIRFFPMGAFDFAGRVSILSSTRYYVRVPAV